MRPRADIHLRAVVIGLILAAPFWLGVVVAARRWA